MNSIDFLSRSDKKQPGSLQSWLIITACSTSTLRRRLCRPRAHQVERKDAFQPVTPDDVRKVILDIPTNKAPGFDKVPISVVKDCLEHILPTSTDLINHSFSSSVFLPAWRKGEVVPHRKEGDHEVTNNNRPVS